MNRAEYVERLSACKDEVVNVLKKKGVKETHLAFGGPGAEPKRKYSGLSGERSDFSVHRPVGDWAEHIATNALSKAFPEWCVARYGDTYAGRAGTTEFNDLRKRQLLETRLYGKRPDLLIFPPGTSACENLCSQPCEATESTVKQAIASVEIRSSKFDALKYIAARKAQRDSGKKASRDAPSFTVKVEDLVIVYRWIERYKVPQTYCQVFLDSVFAINVLEIFSLIASGKDYKLDTHERSQGKPTIMISVIRAINLAVSARRRKFLRTITSRTLAAMRHT